MLWMITSEASMKRIAKMNGDKWELNVYLKLADDIRKENHILGSQ